MIITSLEIHVQMNRVKERSVDDRPHRIIELHIFMYNQKSDCKLSAKLLSEETQGRRKKYRRRRYFVVGEKEISKFYAFGIRWNVKYSSFDDRFIIFHRISAWYTYQSSNAEYVWVQVKILRNYIFGTIYLSRFLE